MQDLILVDSEVSPIVREAQEVTISNEDDKVKASEVLSRLNKWNDMIVEDRERITKPINESLKSIRDKYRPIESVLNGAIDLIRSKLGTYQTKMLREQKENEARIADRVGEGRGKIKIETAMKKIDALEKVEQSVVTDSGAVTFRTDRVLKITNEKIIPRQFFVLDEVLVLRSLKNGAEIAGCELEEIQTVVNKR